MLAFCRYTSIAEHAQRGDVPRTIRLRFKASWVQHPWNTSVLRTLLDKSTTFCNKRQWPAYEPDAHQEPAAHACSCYIQNNLYHKLGLVKMVLAKLTGALINKADRPWVVRQPCPSPPPPSRRIKIMQIWHVRCSFPFYFECSEKHPQKSPEKVSLENNNALLPIVCGKKSWRWQQARSLRRPPKSLFNATESSKNMGSCNALAHGLWKSLPAHLLAD